MTSQSKTHIKPKYLIQSHPEQYKIATNKTRFKVVVTGRRWGKSFLGDEVALKIAKDTANKLIWIVAPTREMAKDIHWDHLKKRVKQLHWKVIINETNLSIHRINNNSKIVLKTADNPDRLRGRGLDLVIVDEFRDMEQNIWSDVLRPALTDKKGDALFISTPNGKDILYDLYLKGLGDSLEWKSWHYKTIDSPFIEDSEIEQARNDLDERTFKQEYEADFETGGNPPYYAYNYLNHSTHSLNYDIPVIVSCDFNATEKPMSWNVGQRLIQGVTDVTHWVNTMSYQFTNTETMCGILDDYLKSNSSYPKHLIFYGDYAGRAMKSNSSYSDWQIIEDYFRNKTKFEKRIKFCKSIRDSIAATNSQLCNTKNERKMFVNPENCKALIKDFEHCSWKDNGKELTDKDDLRGHACRAVDYYNDYEHSTREKLPSRISKTV